MIENEFIIGDRCVYLTLAGNFVPGVVIGINENESQPKYRVKLNRGEVSAEAAIKDLGWSRIFTKKLLQELIAEDKNGNTGLEDHYWEGEK